MIILIFNIIVVEISWGVYFVFKNYMFANKPSWDYDGL
jgi:hypothetical protein